jgi:hypothetical protein
MRLNRHAFRLLVNHHLVAIEPASVSVRPLGALTARQVPVDVVVVVTSQVPVRGLFDELRDKLPSVQLVGNALSPRDLLAAMHDGHRCARAIA